MKCLATFVFVLLIVGRTYAVGNVIDGPDADLVYDYRTGLVVVDGADLESERFFGFAIGSHSIRTIPSDRLPIFPGGQELCDCGYFLGFQDWSGVGAEFVDLGEILQPGMRSAAELHESLWMATYLFAIDPEKDFPFVWRPLDLVVVPEPTGMVLGWALVLLYRCGRDGRRRLGRLR